MKKEPLTMKKLIDGEYEKCKNSVEYFITAYTTIPTNKKLNQNQRQILECITSYISNKEPTIPVFLTGITSYKLLVAFCLWKMIFNDSIIINVESNDKSIAETFGKDTMLLNNSMQHWLKVPHTSTSNTDFFKSNITSSGRIIDNELEITINNSGTITCRTGIIKNEEPSKERRVINIPKEQFDIIQKHCDANSLDMAKWMVNNSTSLINQPTTYTMIASTEANTRQSECESETIPVNWLYIVMKEINNDILFMTGTRSSDKFIYWGGVCETKTKYGHYAFYDLDDSQIRVLKLELNKYGYTLERDLTTYTKAMRYKISW